MEGGPSKINPPNSHPSNATAESKKSASIRTQTEQKIDKKPANTETSHENNKTWLISGLVLTAFVLSHAFS